MGIARDPRNDRKTMCKPLVIIILKYKNVTPNVLHINLKISNQRIKIKC